MTRAELAAAVNDHVRAHTGRTGALRGQDVWRYEQGEVRWPNRLYREGMRAVLNVGSDQELGFSSRSRGPSMPSADVIVRAVIRKDTNVLVTRRQGQGWSFLPGGRVGPGESVEGALLREVARQVGAPARIIRFVGAVEHGNSKDRMTGPVITLAFETEITALVSLPPARDVEVDWLPVADLTNHGVRPTALSRALTDSADGLFWHARPH